MKKSYKVIILICLFFLILGYSIKILKTPDPSPAHTPHEVSEKVYSEKLSKVCNEIIDTIQLPDDVKIPADPVAVYVLDNSAIVDFSKSPDFSGNFEFEQVFIYSIVNTLTQEKGVMTVEFTAGGKTVPSFGGEIDMSETFIPDYDIIS